eukprot:scaffold17279_cov22-Prasinocladus_malaysianus.AAC.1
MQSTSDVQAPPVGTEPGRMGAGVGARVGAGVGAGVGDVVGVGMGSQLHKHLAFFFFFFFAVSFSPTLRHPETQGNFLSQQPQPSALENLHRLVETSHVF